MKNRKILRFVGILSLFAILFSSCSKDSLSKPSTQTSKLHSHNDPISNEGSIKALLQSPNALSMSIVVSNDKGFISEETFADQDGIVTINNLPEGIYTITAHAYIPNSAASSVGAVADFIDVTVTITDVQVIADQVTDLGTITFPQ